MRKGDRVKLISHRWIDAPDNPRWGGRFGKITGKVSSISTSIGLQVRVNWANGEHNGYNSFDLVVINGRTRRTKARQKKAPKKRKRIVGPLIEISAPAFNVLSRALKSFHKKYGSNSEDSHNYPYCFLLGKNKNGILTKATRLKRAGNMDHDACNKMANIAASIIAKASIKIYKEHAIPCGIARVGSFRLDQRFGTRGHSLEEVGAMGGFILSMTKEGIKVEQSISGKAPTYRYKIVMDGEQKRNKSTRGRR